MTAVQDAVDAVVDAAKWCSSRGWLPATSGNLSAFVERDPFQFAITRSGVDKTKLAAHDVLVVDHELNVKHGGPDHRPSAETYVHVGLYEKFACSAILHVHTMGNNLISELYKKEGYVPLEDHELLKALGHWEEGASMRVPIVPNYSDLVRLGEAVADAALDGVSGVLVHNHGIYAWGDSVDSAKRHLEAFEFLFEYTLRRKLLNI